MTHKPIRAWAVVCRKGTIHCNPDGPWIGYASSYQRDLHPIWRTRFLCGPHRIVELIEKPKKRKGK